MRTSIHFRSYLPNQILLLPPDMAEWLEKDDQVYFIMDVIKNLDPDPICYDCD